MGVSHPKREEENMRKLSYLAGCPCRICVHQRDHVFTDGRHGLLSKIRREFTNFMRTTPPASGSGGHAQQPGPAMKPTSPTGG